MSSEDGVVWTHFAALRLDAAAWTPQQLAQQRTVVVEGQLVHQRRISRKCSFYDLAEHHHTPTDAAEIHAQPAPTALRLEVILKIIANELSEDALDAIRRGVNVGDIVRIHGFIERSGDDESAAILLHARNITSVRAWKDVHPGVPFTPAPTVRSETRSSTAGRTPDASETSSVSTANSKGVHCKFWINSRTCQYGDRCELVHASDADLKHARAAWLQERLHLKRLRATQEDDPHDAHGKIGKHQRAQVFVEWLVAQFGLAHLSTGSGVVDVAGGRGNVSFELWNKRGVPCTLIDPRPLKLSKQQFKFMKKLKKTGDSVRQELVSQCLGLFNMTTFFEQPEHTTLIANASMLVGMHPDEATDAIVDVALQFDKPFVLVPCCVFGHQFPDRVRPDGGRVVSYDDLVTYLMAKDARIEKAFLPFDGKNLVLFRRPTGASDSSSSAHANESSSPARD